MQGRLDHAALNTTWTSAGTILNESGPPEGKTSQDHAVIWSVGPCRAHGGGGPRFSPKERGVKRGTPPGHAPMRHMRRAAASSGPVGIGCRLSSASSIPWSLARAFTPWTRADAGAGGASSW